MTIDVYSRSEPGAPARDWPDRRRRGVQGLFTIAGTPHVRAAGFHIYDGHFHQADPKERLAALLEKLRPIQAMQLRARKGWRRGSEDDLRRDAVVSGVCNNDRRSRDRANPGACVRGANSQRGSRTWRSSNRSAAARRQPAKGGPSNYQPGVEVLGPLGIPPMGQRVVLPKMPAGCGCCTTRSILVVGVPNADDFKPGNFVEVPARIFVLGAPQEAYVIADGDLVGRGLSSAGSEDKV